MRERTTAAHSADRVYETHKASMPGWWWPFAFIIGAVPTLIVAFRLERRWNRAGRRRHKLLRALLLYASAAIVLAAMPFYLLFLNQKLYVAEKKPEAVYAISCFHKDKVLYASLAVENRTNKTEFVPELYVIYDKARHFLALRDADIFDGLKADMAVKPHPPLRFRATFGPKDALVAADCSIARKRPKGDPTAAKAQIFRD